jgi:predicted permease
MALGYLLRKLGLLKEEAISGLTTLLIKAALPCSVFMALMREFSSVILVESLTVLVFSMTVNFLGFAMSIPLGHFLKGTPKEKAIWSYIMAFSNVGFIGFPLMNTVFGGDGLIFTSMSNVSFNLMAFTLGVWIFTHGKGDGKGEQKSLGKKFLSIFLNPSLVTTLAGFIFFLFQLRLPKVLENGVSLMAGMTSPLSMVAVGAVLARSKLSSIFSGWKHYVVLAFRLGVIPLTAFAIASPFISNPPALGAVVILSGTPAASLTVVFAEEYGGDTDLGSRIIFISTILSLLTVPLLSFLF